MNMSVVVQVQCCGFRGMNQYHPLTRDRETSQAFLPQVLSHELFQGTGP